MGHVRPARRVQDVGALRVIVVLTSFVTQQLLDGTDVVAALCVQQVNGEGVSQRDSHWRKQFLAALCHASLQSSGWAQKRNYDTLPVGCAKKPDRGC